MKVARLLGGVLCAIAAGAGAAHAEPAPSVVVDWNQKAYEIAFAEDEG